MSRRVSGAGRFFEPLGDCNMPDLIPAAAKKKMEAECKKIARKAGRAIKPDKVGDKIEEEVVKNVCKEIKSVDKKVVQFLADQLKKELDKKKKKDVGPTVSKMPKAGAKWSAKKPGAGVPSLTIPITQWVLDPKYDTKAKFSIKVWADPREFEKKDKGVMVYFTVVDW
ncbi:hypothetical protein [Pukyongiella litopenaei]|uniref:Uncharacterized protein n=1 Tax=Pukyongiella litopenaei TaxID=2605946 RepID=A0A2S0MR96_9RHOB|nr:hypothetical protein [Pukyongiella litopenaei]AVO38394.2 hypothetical protein C6Y53_12315 [Pukyongiella litopenaei]